MEAKKFIQNTLKFQNPRALFDSTVLLQHLCHHLFSINGNAFVSVSTATLQGKKSSVCQWPTYETCTELRTLFESQ